MATFMRRSDKNGNDRITVVVRVKSYPRQTATFRNMTLAKDWAQRTEAAIKDGRHFKDKESKKHTLKELVDRFVVESWSFRLKGAPEEMLQRTVLYSRLINSSMGMVGPDDLEVYRRMQEGLVSSGSDWIEYHRQYGRDKHLEDRVVGGGTSDLDMRTQFGAWKNYMTSNL